MVKSNWILQYWVEKIGWLGFVGILLTTFVAIYLIFLRPPIEGEILTKRNNLEMSAKMNSDSILSSKKMHGVLEERNHLNNQLTEFNKGFVNSNDASLIWAQLWNVAEKLNIEFPKANYTGTELTQLNLKRYDLTIPFVANFPQLMNFIASVMSKQRSMALIGIELKRESVNTTQLNVNLHFALYANDTKYKK